jgi:hypothetical protein
MNARGEAPVSLAWSDDQEVLTVPANGAVEPTGLYARVYFPGAPPFADEVDARYFEEVALVASGGAWRLRIRGGDSTFDARPAGAEGWYARGRDGAYALCDAPDAATALPLRVLFEARAP